MKKLSDEFLKRTGKNIDLMLEKLIEAMPEGPKYFPDDMITDQPDRQIAAEIIREKGTNRARFFRGQVDKYTWVEAGSSYLPSELNAAYLWAQLEKSKEIIIIFYSHLTFTSAICRFRRVSFP